MEFLPTISLVLPVIATLVASLESQTTDPVIIKQIKGTLRHSIEERFPKVFQNKMVSVLCVAVSDECEYHLIQVLLATVLDPRWKNFTFLQSSAYQQHVETHACLTKMSAFDAKLLSYIHLHDEYTANVAADPDLSQWKSQQDVDAQDNTDFFDLMVINQPVKSGGDSDPEFVMYENEREIGRNENPLEWWRSNKSKYPRIGKMAYRYLSIMASSAPSERMFSASGHLTSDRRSRLTPNNANILLFLNKNS